MPKAAPAANSAAEAAAASTNSFTSARVAVFNRRAAWKEGSRICEQFFGFLSKKTFAVESSSHARAAPAGGNLPPEWEATEIRFLARGRARIRHCWLL